MSPQDAAPSEGTRSRYWTPTRFVKLTIIVACASAIGYAVTHSGSHYIRSPLVEQMSEMRQIGMKLRAFDLDHPATETETLKDKSINDLVALNILSAGDAAYLRDHNIKFYGYDPNRISGDVPLLEGMFPLQSPHWRIVVHSDISAVRDDLQ